MIGKKLRIRTLLAVEADFPGRTIVSASFNMSVLPGHEEPVGESSLQLTQKKMLFMQHRFSGGMEPVSNVSCISGCYSLSKSFRAINSAVKHQVLWDCVSMAVTGMVLSKTVTSMTQVNGTRQTCYKMWKISGTGISSGVCHSEE